MQVNNSINQALNLFKQNDSSTAQTKTNDQLENLEETFNKSAVKVTISMNAQVILMAMEATSTMKDNTILQGSLSTQQQDVLDFLSGKTTSGGLNLENIGYKGKPITELSSDEAKELISEDGFFGVNQTSQRVADFIFAFSNDNLELLQKGREGVIQGFEEAQKLFGGNLPEISHQTQERTLALIDEKIASLTNSQVKE